ncbi:MAG: hypothetical protein K9N51_08885 [Candidatus Pacebacteria bacterium]|nr:hypothetical protein [Candidatus Paceibacterota bacterium]
MCAKFLSDQLMKSMKFRPGHSRTNEVPAPPDNDAVATGEKPEELEQLLRKEDEETRAVVARRDINETRRRRSEVLNLLDTTAQDLAREKQFFDEKLRLFAELAEQLREHPDEFDTSELLDVKRKVRSANLEVAKFVRETTATPDDNTRDNLPRGYSWGRLALLGLGITWPLIAVIVASVAILVIVLHSLFSV